MPRIRPTPIGMASQMHYNLHMTVRAAASEPGLAMTATGIPQSLEPFFQDCTFEHVHPHADAFTVIERTLSWGNRAELRWLFRQYKRAQVAEIVRLAGWQRIPPHRFFYWLNILQITDYQKSDYPRIWPH